MLMIIIPYVNENYHWNRKKIDIKKYDHISKKLSHIHYFSNMKKQQQFPQSLLLLSIAPGGNQTHEFIKNCFLFPQAKNS